MESRQIAAHWTDVYKRQQSLLTDFRGMKRTFPGPAAGVYQGLIPNVANDLGMDFSISAGAAMHAHPMGDVYKRQDVEDPDDADPGMDEIKIMEDSVAEIIPELREARMLRLCTGVRPLYTTGEETGRNISRGMFLLDHEEMEGISGMITITGGKYATARLMAEVAVDMACEKLVGKVLPCTSDKELIYGATTKEEAEKEAQEIHEKYHISRYAAHKFTARYGEFAKAILEKYPEQAYVIDDAVQMIGSEVCYSFQEEDVENFKDLRRRTRIGMGQEQGTFSIYKAGGIAQQALDMTPAQACLLYTSTGWLVL